MVPPKPTTDILDRVSFGKLLLDLRYFRNKDKRYIQKAGVNYCLDCGTSETYRSVHICVDKVNYYLDYRTSETGSS